MSEPVESLTPKQEQAILALLSAPTIAAAAQQAEVGERTLRGWLDLPEFRRAYRTARQQVLDQTVSRLLNLSGKALDALEANLGCDSAAARNRAAETILAHAHKGLETLDLAERVEELERLEQQRRQPRRPCSAGSWPSNSRRSPAARLNDRPSRSRPWRNSLRCSAPAKTPCESYYSGRQAPHTVLAVASWTAGWQK